MFKIVFDNAARDAARISTLDRQIITDCATKAGLAFAVVTSTARSAEEQALAMYRNCVANGRDANGNGIPDGCDEQFRLYSKFGDLVVQVYLDYHRKGITAEATVVNAMTRMIKQIGAERVSAHCVSDWSVKHIIDLSARRIEKSKWSAFEGAVKADHRISKYFSPLTPNIDRHAWHLEIDQQQAV